MLIISWIWSILGTALGVILLVMILACLAGTVFAIIGAFRKRCSWVVSFLYLGAAIVGILIYRGIFLVTLGISAGDTISVQLSTVTLIVMGLGAIPVLPKTLRQVWIVTNKLKEKSVQAAKSDMGWFAEGLNRQVMKDNPDD